VALAAGLPIGAACVGLLAVCWRNRTLLGGVCALAGLALIGVAIASGNQAALLAAAAALVIGAALFGLGQGVQRLLDAEPPDGD